MNQNQVALNRTPPEGIRPQTSRAVFNNDYANALASGDPRYNVKQYDRGGISRGRTQWGQAGIDGAGRLADGIAQAYSQRQADVAANANTQMQFDQQQQGTAQQLAAMQQQQANDRAMQALSRQQQQMSFVNSLLGGLLN